jgi:hypothetical protein
MCLFYENQSQCLTMEQPTKKEKFKQKLKHEFSEYLVNFVYMAIIFSAIILYRRLVLASHGIYLHDYFFGVIKAFVIAKVVMLAAFMKVSRLFENKSLVVSTLYKAFYFTLTVMLFDVIEGFIRSLILLGDFDLAVSDILAQTNSVWLGGSLLIFFVFIPFFAFRELVRILGKEKVRDLFMENAHRK